MNVWLVSPAWGRFAVARLALAQRQHLVGELASRGIQAHGVIVADDENLDIAREYGFHTVEMDNTQLGRKVNAGIRFACEHGADYVVPVGSDDWVHPDLFDPLLEMERTSPKRTRPVLTGALMTVVDLIDGRLQRVRARGKYGTIPWVLHVGHHLRPCKYEPVEPEKQRGIDGSMVRGMLARRVKPEWVFHDPHALARVDFKTDVNITPYRPLAKTLGYGREEEPWPVLAERYPAHLVEMARETHLALR